jgi:hypothetical protein
MDQQYAFNILVGICGALGGWVLNNVRDAVLTLQEQDAKLAEKVQRIEVLVAGAYVKRDELQTLIDFLYSKIEKIDANLDRKIKAVELNKYPEDPGA